LKIVAVYILHNGNSPTADSLLSPSSGVVTCYAVRSYEGVSKSFLTASYMLGAHEFKPSALDTVLRPHVNT